MLLSSPITSTTKMDDLRFISDNEDIHLELVNVGEQNYFKNSIIYRNRNI